MKDNGKGVPPEILTKLNDKAQYYSSKKVGGVGLYLCRLFAEKHAGEFRVDSRFNEYFEASLWLPISRSEW